MSGVMHLARKIHLPASAAMCVSLCRALDVDQGWSVAPGLGSRSTSIGGSDDQTYGRCLCSRPGVVRLCVAAGTASTAGRDHHSRSQRLRCWNALRERRLHKDACETCGQPVRERGDLLELTPLTIPGGFPCSAEVGRVER
jgi:hypothetical protein